MKENNEKQKSKPIIVNAAGTEKPHEHYFLIKSGLQKYDNVEIYKDNGAIFSLKIKRL